MAATPGPHPHRSPAQLTLHPQAGLVPEATLPEYRELLADVSERGVVTPLEVTGEDVLLDRGNGAWRFQQPGREHRGVSGYWPAGV